MTTIAAPKLITADELLAMGDIGRCELLYGEIVMMSPVGLEHGVVALRIGSYLLSHVEENDLGVCLAAETGYRIETNPDLVRAPDSSFIRKERVKGKLTKKFFSGVPDLAVEVVSPEDTRREVAEKVNMWLAHGTQAVWVADPTPMSIAIHRVGREPEKLGVGDELRDEMLLPGFVLPLSKVFKLP